jgi:DNA repair and recombination RAD54-like protein
MINQDVRRHVPNKESTPNPATVSPASMYRRDGLERDTASVQQRSLVLVKAFKTPAVAAPPREQPTRKRKRVSYKENADENDGTNSESDGPRKKRKRFDEYTPLAELTANINASFPIYEPKPRQRVFTQRFAIPTMKNKDGSTIKLLTSNVSLGIRPPIQILPKPLHDPMADHAVVLYDPTVDDRETDEERLERLKGEAKEKARKEAEAKVIGMHNPHKSLRELLGGSTKKVSKRVPVVIDPILSKILRPHQIEGVRVSFPLGKI